MERNSKGQFVKMVETQITREEYIRSFKGLRINTFRTESVYPSENIKCVDMNCEMINEIRKVIEFLKPNFIKFDADEDCNKNFNGIEFNVFLRNTGIFWANGRCKNMVILELNRAIDVITDIITSQSKIAEKALGYVTQEDFND